MGEQLLLGRRAGRREQLDRDVVRLERCCQRHHRRQDARVAVDHGHLGAHLRAEPVERTCAAGARRCGRGRHPLRRRPAGQRTRRRAARRFDHGADAGRRADVPVQQPRRAPGSDARRRRLLHAAGMRKRQQPLVVGRGGCGGRLRLPGQDVAGLPGATGIHRGISVVGKSSAGPAAAGYRHSGRGDGRRRRLVPLARRSVAVRRPAVHRGIPARQHHRTGVGLQRIRPADGERDRRAGQHELRRRLGQALRAQHGHRDRLAACLRRSSVSAPSWFSPAGHPEQTSRAPRQ